jgi:hypothetical protein
MGLQESGPTLEGLAERLEALERENATLRRQVATLENSETEQGAEPTSDAAEEKVSRRALLGKAAAAAVAATAAGTLLSPREAKAETFSSVESNSFVSANTNILANGFVRADGGSQALLTATPNLPWRPTTWAPDRGFWASEATPACAAAQETTMAMG